MSVPTSEFHSSRGITNNLTSRSALLLLSYLTSWACICIYFGFGNMRWRLLRMSCEKTMLMLTLSQRINYVLAHHEKLYGEMAEPDGLFNVFGEMNVNGFG